MFRFRLFDDYTFPIKGNGYRFVFRRYAHLLRPYGRNAEPVVLGAFAGISARLADLNITYPLLHTYTSTSVPGITSYGLI